MGGYSRRCRSCGASIGEKAETCPVCGKSNRTAGNSQLLWPLLGVLALVLMIVVACVGVDLSNGPYSYTQPTLPPPTDTSEDYIIIPDRGDPTEEKTDPDSAEVVVTDPDEEKKPSTSIIADDDDDKDANEKDYDYVLNKNTKKFHDTVCGHGDRINDSNRLEFRGDREEVIAMGYEPCEHCNP